MSPLRWLLGYIGRLGVEKRPYERQGGKMEAVGMTWGMIGRGLLGIWLGWVTAAAAQLPPEILADRYLVQAERLMKEKDFKGAVEAMEKIVELQKEHGLTLPAEFHFKYAQIAQSAGLLEVAIDAVKRYLVEAGREGKWYREALELLDRAEAGESAGTGTGSGSAGVRVGETVVLDGMEFVGVPAGEFQMGSTGPMAYDNEQPLTRVRISRGFYLGKYEVTQDEWQAVMGSNPSDNSGCGRCPVEEVSWEEVQDFIGRLNARSGGGRYRLPTEAEWEYAARGGTTTETYAGDLTQRGGNVPVLNGIAWYDENSGGRTQPVGEKTPNGFGLHDMLGNVYEWVGDWYGEYPGGPVTDSVGPQSGSKRVFRGGSWINYARDCRSAIRYGDSPGNRGRLLGFRLLRTE